MATSRVWAAVAEDGVVFQLVRGLRTQRNRVLVKSRRCFRVEGVLLEDRRWSAGSLVA